MQKLYRLRREMGSEMQRLSTHIIGHKLLLLAEITIDKSDFAADTVLGNDDTASVVSCAVDHFETPDLIKR